VRHVELLKNNPSDLGYLIMMPEAESSISQDFYSIGPDAHAGIAAKKTLQIPEYYSIQ